MQCRCFTTRSVSQLSLALAIFCFAIPWLFDATPCPCIANPRIAIALPYSAIPRRCNVSPYSAYAPQVIAPPRSAIAIPRHTVAEHRNSEPNIAAAMLGFAYIALALLCSTQRCLCFATFSAAEPCRCTTELCHATLYHCLVMLLYTLPLPHYSLLRSTLPLRYISVLHDAAPYLSFTKHSHCFSEQLTTLPLRRSEVQDYAVALPRKPRLCRTLAQST